MMSALGELGAQIFAAAHGHCMLEICASRSKYHRGPNERRTNSTWCSTRTLVGCPGGLVLAGQRLKWFGSGPKKCWDLQRLGWRSDHFEVFPYHPTRHSARGE
jgi:hypothetical protein